MTGFNGQDISGLLNPDEAGSPPQSQVSEAAAEYRYGVRCLRVANGRFITGWRLGKADFSAMRRVLRVLRCK